MKKIIHEVFDLSDAVISEAINPYLLSNVKIVGIKSKNKREYPYEVLEKALTLYENCPVYLDHQADGKNRRYTDRVGSIKNTTMKKDGMYGDLQLNPKHTLAESIQYDFQNNSKDVGLSHIVEADMSGNKVTKVHAVRSCDLVCNPATTCSLRESEETELETELGKMKKTLDETLDKLSEINESNAKLIGEVAELKAKKPTSYVPQATEDKIQPFDAKTWALKIQRKF